MIWVNWCSIVRVTHHILWFRCLLLVVSAISVPVSFAQDVSRSTPSFTSIESTSSSSTAYDTSNHLELSSDEWDRHEQLVSELRKYLSNSNISPLEVLGIHAEDAATRREYAKRWARIVYEDTQRVLEFQRDFDAAMRELVADQPLIDVSRLPSRMAAPEIVSTDRLLLFVTLDCYLCSIAIETILKHLETFKAVDVYFTDITYGDETLIQTWASDHGLDPSLVEAGKITLNYDNGTLEEIYPRANNVPVLLRLRNGIPSPVSLSELKN